MRLGWIALGQLKRQPCLNRRVGGSLAGQITAIGRRLWSAATISAVSAWHAGGTARRKQSRQRERLGPIGPARKKKPVRRRAREPPPLPCRTRSFEHVLLHVELVCPLSASNQGMPATNRTYSVIVFITVQGLLRITNRAGKFSCNQRTVSRE